MRERVRLIMGAKVNLAVAPGDSRASCWRHHTSYLERAMRSLVPGLRRRHRHPAPALLVALLGAVCTPLAAQVDSGLPIAEPEDVGMDAAALARIGPAMQAALDQGRTAGVMTMVARRGRIVHWDARGSRVLGEDPLERDDVFRIYSMTKPVTSVAAMMLIEEGRLGLDTELGDVLPAFLDVRVYAGPGRDRAPERPITIADLLAHTSGLTYGAFGETPVDSLYRAAGLGVAGTGRNLEETVDAIADLPLVTDPGEEWIYSMSTDVLGRVIEVVSGMTLDRFFAERIFAPLGMEDTGFAVQPEDRDRFTAVYGPGPEGLVVLDPADGPFLEPPSWLSGGGGLVSTASDYVRFAQMLVNEGELDGVRILRPETVRAMRINRIGDQRVAPQIGGPDQGFGLGFAVSEGEQAGTYWWLGVASTHFWIDPVEELVVFVWTQFQPMLGSGVDRVMRPLVYDALVEREREPVPSGGEWTEHGGDDAETRYSSLDQVNASNVDRLQEVWSWEIPKSGGRIETTPLVVDGVMYGTGAMSFVFALDARTGEELWSWDPGILMESEGGPPTCCGKVNRGVALEGDRVFVGLLDGRLVALDRHTGELVWSVQTTPPGTDYSITGAPRVIADGELVVIGNGGAEYGVRGFVTAYAVGSGEQVWRTHTVPGNPADGFESDAMRAAAETWTGEWWTVGGGGTVWDGMAWDPDAGEDGLLYIGTGNGSPWSRDHRSPGGGDNLYLSSIVALAPGTGEYVWHYQTTPGDDWDYTATQPLMLLDLEIDGRPREVIVQAPKNGFFYVLDRHTGELISAEAFTEDLNWASGIDAETGRPVENPEARYGRTGRGIYVFPGAQGAHNWHPMSWNAGTGLVYIPAQNNNLFYELSDDFEYTPGVWNTGLTSLMGAADRPTRPPLAGPRTLLLAWDPVTNSEVWRAPSAGTNGGSLSTAGNLVFWGSGSRLVAHDASTGEELWAAEIGRGTGSPVTYRIDGVQYITLAGGQTEDGTRVATFALPDGD